MQDKHKCNTPCVLACHFPPPLYFAGQTKPRLSHSGHSPAVNPSLLSAMQMQPLQCVLSAEDSIPFFLRPGPGVLSVPPPKTRDQKRSVPKGGRGYCLKRNIGTIDPTRRTTLKHLTGHGMKGEKRVLFPYVWGPRARARLLRLGPFPCVILAGEFPVCCGWKGWRFSPITPVGS